MFTNGLAVIFAASPNPFDQEYEYPTFELDAVKVVELPKQTSVLPATRLIAGGVFTVAVTASLGLVQLPFVSDT